MDLFYICIKNQSLPTFIYKKLSRNTLPMSANMNNYVDIIMIQVGPWLNENYIPIDLPDVVEGFEHTPIIITYHGELELTNGLFHNIQSVVRNGPATMHYDGKLLRVVVGATLRQLAFTYDYSAHIMDLGPTGWVDVDVATTTFQSEFIINLDNFFIYLGDFRLTDMGSLNIRFRGNVLVDWLTNIFVSIITTVFNNTIRNVVSNTMREFIQATLDEMNARIQAQGRVMNEQDMFQFAQQLKFVLQGSA
ncbi:uncharacterized protein LOC131430270 isoform X2 [Malaya genurostris]|uniref:uncharacterized protein LOC131430270 isoform X2 n=1 Tax=Malaya genurostris TaxID=325434 RepID=UPI0026F3DE01|nr:uncharacterized protein LOC131430270 isoform X2 [Malaya genurostris]